MTRSLLPFVCALAQLSAREARACDPSTQGLISKRNVIPPEGTTGVPTNARVLISYTGLIGDHPKLRASDGAEVAVVVSSLLSGTYVVTPTAPLLPTTTYQVLSDFAQVPCMFGQSSNAAVPFCSGGVDAGSGGSFAISSFTTTTWSDQQRPADFEANSVGISAATCYVTSCCGPYTGFLATLGWSRVEDSGGMVYYEVSSRGALVAAPVLGTSVTGFISCGWSTGGPPEASFAGIPGDYEVVAVDLAGNRGKPHAMPVTVNCNIFDGGLALPPPDAAAERSADVPVVIAPADAGVLDVGEAEGGAREVESPAALDAEYAVGADASVARDVAADAALTSDVPAAAKDAVVTYEAGWALDSGERSTTNADGGCSCRVAGRRQGALASVLLGLLLGLAGGARRRRR